MKKRLVTLLLCVVVVGFSSCHLPGKIPTGTWKFEDGTAVFHFSEEGFGENAGTMLLDGEEQPILWNIDYGRVLSIYDYAALGDDDWSMDNSLLNGQLRYRNDTFYIEVVYSALDRYPVGTEIMLVAQEDASVTVV